jgi:hypothetical protein
MDFGIIKLAAEFLFGRRAKQDAAHRGHQSDPIQRKRSRAESPMRVRVLTAILAGVIACQEGRARLPEKEVPYEPPKPSLEFMARFEVALDAPTLELGQIENLGRRRIIPITGGKFEGPQLKGQILNHGADWQLVLADGLAVIDTRYALKTDDEALIYLRTRGFRHGPGEVLAEIAKGHPVDPTQYYFRVTMQFETSSSRYAWLNRMLAIGSAMRLGNAVVYDAYVVR